MPQAAALRGSDDALAARAERFKGTSAAEDAAAEAAAAAAARPFAPFAGAGRSKLRVVNKTDTMRRFYVRLLRSGSVRQKLLHQLATTLCLHSSCRYLPSRSKADAPSPRTVSIIMLYGSIFGRCQQRPRRVP